MALSRRASAAARLFMFYLAGFVAWLILIPCCRFPIRPGALTCARFVRAVKTLAASLYAVLLGAAAILCNLM